MVMMVMVMVMVTVTMIMMMMMMMMMVMVMVMLMKVTPKGTFCQTNLETFFFKWLKTMGGCDKTTRTTIG